MDIRVMTIQDYDAVYALWMRSKNMGFNNLDDSREGIARYLARNPGTCFVAEADGRVVGAILAGHDGRRGHLCHAAVANDCRRQGIGTALVKAAVQALEARGIHKVNLVVFERNEAGNAFWDRLGFGRREDLVYRDRALADLRRIDT